MVKTAFRPWILAAIAAVAAYVAQLSPMPGIFLMMFMGMLWPGILLHIAMILLVLDCRAGKTPKPLLALPAAFYGTGLVVFALSWFHVFALSQHVASMDVRRPITYDPAQHVVMTAHDNNINSLLRRLQSDYRLDLAFMESPEQETSYFAQYVLPRAQCPQELHNTATGMTRTGFHVRGAFAANACMVRMPARLDRAPISIRTTTSDAPWVFSRARFTRTELQSGSEIASITTAEIRVYPLIPILVAGCGLNSAQASWQCGFDFMTFPRQVGGSGAQGDSARVDAVAALLGLSPRGAVSRGLRGVDVDFAPDALQDATLSAASQQAEQRIETFFEALPSFFAGSVSVAASQHYDIATRYPGQNATHIDALLDGLQATLALQPGARDQGNFAALAIAATPMEALAPRQERLLQIMSDRRAYEDRPALLIRVGDFGAVAVPLLLRELEAREEENRVAAALGLCRAGAAAASPTVSAALLRAAETHPDSRQRMQESALLALVRTGDRTTASQIEFVRGGRTRRDEVLRTVNPQSPRESCEAKSWFFHPSFLRNPL